VSDLAAARTIRSYATYVEAQTVTEWLRSCDFPAEHVDLQVRGLRFVAPEWRRVPLWLLALGAVTLVAVGLAILAQTLIWQQAVFSLLFATPASLVLCLSVWSRRHQAVLGVGYAVADGFDVVVTEQYAEEAITLLQR
jgi:hypothetical protein